ncbi:hypothetical protein [Microbulbifer sp.]|uniref:hypothetical protein n=1 Tax=Microbulbifer sp. TaxID=1908541 RepID=UPI003F3528D4
MNKLLLIIILLATSVGVLAEGNESILWSSERAAVAFCITEEKVTCYVVSGQNVTDVSQVEMANIGKLGRRTKKEYDKVITSPTEWHHSQGDELMVLFTTQAWISGQRYFATEPVFVKNGEYVQR